MTARTAKNSVVAISAFGVLVIVVLTMYYRG